MHDPFYFLHQKHLVLTQFYRWYQVYEVPFSAKRISNQKDILAEEVEILSQAGSTKGKEGLEDRLKVYDGWLNAHHVQHTEVEVLPDGHFSLEADVLYQSIRPDGSQHAYTIHYSTILRNRENDLPLFTRLSLTPTSQLQDFQFVPAYEQNRAASLLHYWYYLIETSREGTQKFSELLAPEFVLHLSDGTLLDSPEAFELWLIAVAARVQTGFHTFRNLKTQPAEAGTFKLSVDVLWTGIVLGDRKITGETHHEWLIQNDMDERFARIKTMHITTLVPFTEFV